MQQLQTCLHLQTSMRVNENSKYEMDSMDSNFDWLHKQQKVMPVVYQATPVSLLNSTFIFSVYLTPNV